MDISSNEKHFDAWATTSAIRRYYFHNLTRAVYVCTGACDNGSRNFLKRVLLDFSSGVCEIKYHFQTARNSFANPSPSQSKLKAKSWGLYVRRDGTLFHKRTHTKKYTSNFDWEGEGGGESQGPILEMVLYFTNTGTSRMSKWMTPLSTSFTIVNVHDE